MSGCASPDNAELAAANGAVTPYRLSAQFAFVLLPLIFATWWWIVEG
jgi:hypothetical protein